MYAGEDSASTCPTLAARTKIQLSPSPSTRVPTVASLARTVRFNNGK